MGRSGVAAAGRAVLSGRNAFLVLKAFNLVVITAYSFELIYVLVRILSADLYPVAVLISSLGVYIMATDLGYSGFVYYRTRQSFLDRGAPHGSEAEVFVLYSAITVAAALAMAIGLEVFSSIPAGLRIGLSLYFFSIVLALPWGLLRRIAAAVDLYLAFELFELIRRLFFFASAASMLAGLPLAAFGGLCLAAWAVAFTVAIGMLRRRRGMVLTTSSAAAVRQHIRLNYRNIVHSGLLSLIEFVIYNYPYIALPLLYSDKSFIIAFDIFYKVIRFGAVSYSVAAETFLPSQTRAFYAKDTVRVMRHYRTVILLGLLPLGVSLLVLFGFGDRVFTILLSRGGVIDLSLRVSMAVMLIAMLLQSSAGTFLLGTGNYRQLSRLALISLGLMAGLVAGTWALGLSFHSFMSVYVAIYIVHTVIYTVYMVQFLQSYAGRAPLPRAAEAGL